MAASLPRRAGSRIAFTISGASSVSRSTRETRDELIFPAAANSLVVARRPVSCIRRRQGPTTIPGCRSAGLRDGRRLDLAGRQTRAGRPLRRAALRHRLADGAAVAVEDRAA